jgi:hypothetical protein
MKASRMIHVVVILICCGSVSVEGGQSQVSSPQATVRRADSRIRFIIEDAVTVIEVTSSFGIDKATVTRQEKQWPAAIVVRLHLRGLESFKASRNEVAVEWSVSSTAENANRVTLWQDGRELAIQRGSPYYTAARVVGEGNIPLKHGYFEIPLPAKLLEDNPQQITLQWIDFYRN